MNIRISYVLLIVFSLLCPVIWSGLGAANDADGNGGSRKPNMTGTFRVLTEKELDRVSQKDRDLSPSVSLRIPAKLNARDFDYIAQDIHDGTPIKVPNDFTAVQNLDTVREIHPGCC